MFDLVPGLEAVEPIIRTPGCPTLRLVQSCPLLHYADCALIGVHANGQVAIEEYYDDWLAQYVFDDEGNLVALCDEDEGRTIDPPPIPDHDLFIPPPSVDRAAVLNHVGARWQGLREEDRIADMAAPLSVAEKMLLGRLGIPSPIVGLVESYVLAEAQVTDALSVVIRRLRVAFAVPTNTDENGDAYDYDSIPIYIAQWFNRHNDSAPLDQGVIALGTRPMDAQCDGHRLFIADGGEYPRSGALHIYEIED